MSHYIEIQTALDSKLNTLTGSTDIAWENVEYRPSKGTAYIRPTLIMSPSALMDINTLQWNQGIYQLDLFYPTGKGVGAMLNKMDAIYDHFKNGTKLTSGSIDIHIKQINRLNTNEVDKAWIMGSLEIHFTCYSA